MATCNAAGCDRPTYARGHCPRHYKQLLRHGETKPERTGPKLCAVVTCERPAASRGWCHGHYLRWTRTRDVQAEVPLRRSSRGTCSIPGCARDHVSNGLCETHRQRVRMHGDPMADLSVASPGLEGFTHHGYRIVAVPRDERWLTSGKTPVGEHRLVMARSLQRPLTTDESVHHRNGDRQDNRLENLELWTRFQPNGQRVADKLAWAWQVIHRYDEEAVLHFGLDALLNKETGPTTLSSEAITLRVPPSGFEPPSPP